MHTRHMPGSSMAATTKNAQSTTWMSALQKASWEPPLNKVLIATRDDEFGGVIVELQETMDSLLFTASLRYSLSCWMQQGKRGVWIKLPIRLANLVEAVVKEGFYYHHAEPDYLMLAKWLPGNEPNALPSNASHRISVGAFVINEKREVLVVQEKNGMLKGKGVWKFPTGTINEGENICAAAVREVKEETGVDTRFEEVLLFRESHRAFFQKSDAFFICMLQPLSVEIQEQESEIEAAQWMNFEEYAAQPFVQKYELLRYMVKICRARIEQGYCGFQGLSIQPSFRDGRDFIYFSNQDQQSLILSEAQ